ncbi:MAG: hypothetical protein QF629_00235 [Alphaproteobacteria bacterium]|jgi:hypothetical protein|nr:hypothetical protein [Alphaproteobacteria bacterium]MDP6238821.1 hypothetical protein [Alphaproteobacteria bacterium]MDP7172125.1 hypothetical protein [Alphaproteobacteria bacterium]MDP7232566.1 hypothetical protein [Alphaproteobacteria bacterium]HJN21333.1 hypothetical protein [Alphaproteobacteria bacterium]|tara:strand:+ start:1460 stop:1621 length:162 start_codon:yes stop_codon:yes gene_type:complete
MRNFSLIIVLALVPGTAFAHPGHETQPGLLVAILLLLAGGLMLRTLTLRRRGV